MYLVYVVSRCYWYRTNVAPVWQNCFNDYDFPEFSDRQVWTNSVDPNQTQFDQGIHCLPFSRSRLIWATMLAILSAFFRQITPCLNFRVITANFSGVWILRTFTIGWWIDDMKVLWTFKQYFSHIWSKDDMTIIVKGGLSLELSDTEN